MEPVPGLDSVLSEDGWVYASSRSTGAGDPGRFHALFGRDSLISALQLLPVRPDLAVATLRALAARQGRRTDPVTLEEPGKIGHEFRDRPPDSFVAAGWPAGEPFRYFATADATSWFLVLLDAAVRAAGQETLADELDETWRAAASWLRTALDSGGGMVRHRPGVRAGGLSQQGWRDSRDPTDSKGGGILRRDGTPPRAPLADADTQAVTVAAARAAFRLSGDRYWEDAAARLKTILNERFLPDVMAEEAGDVPVRGAGSQLGWLLWADAVEPVEIDSVADRLSAPDILTPYGLRTLAATEPQFDALAYHRGSIWPFDSWIGWAGLLAAGRANEAEHLRLGVLDAVAELGAYPELYAVTLAGELRPLPAANRIQAWTVGAHWALTHRWPGRPSG